MIIAPLLTAARAALSSSSLTCLLQPPSKTKVSIKTDICVIYLMVFSFDFFCIVLLSYFN
jgi:hypothetical protein